MAGREMNTIGLPSFTASFGHENSIGQGDYTVTKVIGKFYKLTKKGDYGTINTIYIPEEDIYRGDVSIDRSSGKFTSTKYPSLKDYTFKEEISGEFYKFTIPKKYTSGSHNVRVISSFVKYYPKSEVMDSYAFPGLYDKLPAEMKGAAGDGSSPPPPRPPQVWAGAGDLTSYRSAPYVTSGGARRRKHRGTKKARKHRRYSRRR